MAILRLRGTPQPRNMDENESTPGQDNPESNPLERQAMTRTDTRIQPTSVDDPQAAAKARIVQKYQRAMDQENRRQAEDAAAKEKRMADERQAEEASVLANKLVGGVVGGILKYYYGGQTVDAAVSGAQEGAATGENLARAPGSAKRGQGGEAASYIAQGILPGVGSLVGLIKPKPKAAVEGGDLPVGDQQQSTPLDTPEMQDERVQSPRALAAARLKQKYQVRPVSFQPAAPASSAKA